MSATIGNSIRKYRKMNGMSQKHLAAKVGISTQGLLKIEKNISNTRVATIEKIIEVLGISPNQLFGLEEITKENSDVLHILKQYRKKEDK